jgi:SHS2 domain-containing protein
MSDVFEQMVSVEEHSGDLEFVARGQDEFEALAHASAGLVHQIVPLDQIAEVEARSITVHGDTDTDRAIAFLNELLYLVYVRGWLPRRVRTLTRCNRTGCKELDAVLVGEPVDPARHEFKYDIKAVTYHRFEITHEQDSVILRFVCDL